MADLPSVGWLEALPGDRLHSRPDCPRIADPSTLNLVERPGRARPCLLCSHDSHSATRLVPRQRTTSVDG
jgi:hypothetical protein